jgi:Fe(3+) dicitrate transport protein
MNKSTWLGLLVCAACTAPAAAEEAAVARLEPVTVIGTKDNVDRLPGSGAYIDRAEITQYGYDDIHRLLRQIPGVYVREEDGYGLFPNISLRGADPGRSGKVTLMEDGVLTAPAPYSDPAAYYSPAAARMSALEVLKGSSQIKFGPHTTGGVINYLSTPIPAARQGHFRSAYGSDNEFRNHGYVGETFGTAAGNVGYLVEVYQRQTEGFKTIDIPGFVGPDQGQSGFSRFEPMVKLAFEPEGALYQRIELKYGYSDADADETYLGLTSADFATNPYRRYAGSRFDNIETEHERSHLRHYIEFSADTQLTTTVYYNDFHRNWFKIFGVNDGTSNVSLGSALADPAQAQALAVLRGEAAGTLRYRNNNREYGLRGVETVLRQRFETGPLQHTVHTGLRLHEDYIKRFQNDVNYSQDASGRVTGATFNAPGSQDNRRAETRALAFHIEDAIRAGALTVTPGVRVEQLDWNGQNFRNGTQFEGDDRFVTGGLGLTYDVAPGLALFGGLHQGFSPPSPEGGSDGSEEAEESVSLELGVRTRLPGGLAQELVLFGTRFDNLLVQSNAGASGSGTGNDESVGEVETYGIEYALRYDGGQWVGNGYRLPIQLALTYTSAEIANDVTGTGTGGGQVESIFSGGRKGAKLPYIPEYQATLGIGLEKNQWALAANLQYVDSVFATALNTDDEVILSNTTGTLVPDARGGRVPSFVTLDVSGSLRMNERVKLFSNVFNLLDREYMVSRLPEGPRPGAPLTVLVGAEVSLF